MSYNKADKKMWVTVKSVPDYVEANDYIVARSVNGELWFYGAYKTKNKAAEVMEELGNAVIIH